MAQQKSNWLWWTLGGVALLGVGVGTYMYFRNKSQEEDLKNEGKVFTPPIVPPPPVNQTSGSGNISVTVPFKNDMEGNAFRDWVNNKYPEWAKTNQLDRVGKKGVGYNNSYIQKAWAKYGVEYSAHQSAGSQSPSNSGVQDLQKVMTAMSAYTTTANSSERIQFFLYDGFGDKNIRVNFTPSGYFWIELDASTSVAKKFDGSWSFANNQFTVKLADGSFNGTDPNLAGMLWTMAKQKFPNTVGFSSANGLDDMLNMSGKQYVDSQDSML
jgi:hypothetical protein